MLSSRPLSVLEPPQRAVRLPRKQTQQQQQQANPHKKLNKRPASHAAASANSAAASSLAAVGSNVWIPLNTAEDAVGKSTSTEALDSPAASSEPLGTIQAPSAPAPLAVNDAAVRRAAKHWRHLVQIRRSDSFTNSRLLRRCFLTWHQETAQHQMQAWIGDGDWRSSIRADVHYKFTVCGKAWSAWKAYVDAQKRIKANAVRAQVHAERRSMSTALRAFKAYADHRRAKAAAHHQAASWHRQNCLQRTFRAWMTRFKVRRVAKLQNELALRVRIRSLESRLFAEWERRFRRRQAIRQADGHAQIHCQMRIKRQALGRWKQAHFVRETRVVRQATASTFELRQIARRALCKWRLRWMQAKIKRDKLGTATWCYHRHLARTWFKRWQSETNQHQRAYAKADALSLLYERHAKQRAVRGLMQLVSAKRAAVSWHSKHTMQVAMRRWMHRLSDQQAVRERALLEPGVLHHTTRLTRSCLDAWRLFVSLNKRERDAEDRAANHYRRTLLQKAVSGLMSHSVNSTNKTKRKQLAAQWMQSRLVERAWSVWVGANYDRITLRAKMRKAAAFRQQVVVRQVFGMIRANALHERRLRDQSAAVVAYHEQTLLSKVIRAWSDHVRVANFRANQARTAARFRYFSLLNECILLWHKRLIAKRHERMRWRLAMAHHDRVSAMRHIRAWRGYVNERRTVRTSLAVFIYKREVSAQSRVFSVWRERLMEHHEYDDIVMSIRKLRGMSQAQAVIRAWKTWANTRMLKRRMEEARYQALACARRHDTLKHCFGQWLVVHRRKRHVQRLEQRALHIYQSSYLTRAFALWRGHYRHLVWERYTGELQVHFTQTHLLRRYMDQWVSRRPDWKRIYVARHVQPIAFWGLGLSRKVFSAWQQYVAQRRSSKARIAEAKAWHNRELVRLAVRQWFEADDCLRQERQWESRTSDLSDREQQLGLKYGLRWRVKAMRLASMSGGRSKRMIHHRSADMHPSLLSFKTSCQSHQLRILAGLQLETPCPLADDKTARVPTASSALPAPAISAITSRSRSRPQPRTPEFLFDAVTGRFVRISMPEQASVPSAREPSLPSSSTAMPLDAAQPTLAPSSGPAPPSLSPVEQPKQEQQQPAGHLTTADLSDMESTLVGYQAERSAHKKIEARLKKLQSALDTYLDGDHAVLTSPGIGYSNFLDLYDEIKRLQVQLRGLESQQNASRSRIESFIGRLQTQIQLETRTAGLAATTTTTTTATPTGPTVLYR